MDFIDREKAKYHARENVENMYDQHYVQGQGADQYDPWVPIFSFILDQSTCEWIYADIWRYIATSTPPPTNSTTTVAATRCR